MNWIFFSFMNNGKYLYFFENEKNDKMQKISVEKIKDIKYGKR